MASQQHTSNKIALVTGANRGIGLETVRQLAASGITVLLGARDTKKGSEAAAPLVADDLDVSVIELDVDDAASQDAATKEIQEKFGKLDILIHNAAIFIDESERGVMTPTSAMPTDTLRRTMETNFFNVVELNQKLLPLVRNAEEGRIVFLSSMLGSLTLHSDPKSGIYGYKPTAYDISKSAINAYVVHLAYELRNSKIKVNAAHPGSVLTEMNPSGNLTPAEGARTSVELAMLDSDGPTGKLIHLGNELPW